jgi:hypothetical protein
MEKCNNPREAERLLISKVAVLLSGRAVAGPLAIPEPSRSIIPFTVYTTRGSVVHIDVGWIMSGTSHVEDHLACQTQLPL